MSNQVYSHSPIWWGGKSLHGFVKNLDEKFFRITLDKDYGHYLRVIICLFRPDFPQIPCPTDFSRINGQFDRCYYFFIGQIGRINCWVCLIYLYISTSCCYGMLFAL